MGQTTSSTQPELDLEAHPVPASTINTAEKFQSGFSYEFRHRYVVVRAELREAFDFSDETEWEDSEGQLSWDEHALANFLGHVVPVNLKADLHVAAPLLLKAMIRLGSFPFHNGPAPLTLGADEAFVAILFLIRKHEDFLAYEYEVDDEIRRKRDRYFHRLLFQVMSEKQEQVELSARDSADDEDLILVRNVLQKQNFVGTEDPGRIIRLPPVIAVSELPSSRSRDLTGTIPKAEFQALLNVLCEIGDHASFDAAQLIETYGTEWHGFEAMLTKLEPHFSSGIRQLLDIFVNFSNWWDKIECLETQAAGKPGI